MKWLQLLTVGAVGVLAAPVAAHPRVAFGINIGVPVYRPWCGCGPPVYYYRPYPIYYAPPPVVVAQPAPVVLAPAPTSVTPTNTVYSPAAFRRITALLRPSPERKIM